jgi:P-type Mg2+ transporter
MDVLCTDQTGTLTAGVMALDAAVDTEEAASPKVLRLAYLNAALETGIENPCMEGFRVIALATKRVPAQQRYAVDDEAGMVLD